jgi:hypothetical protein
MADPSDVEGFDTYSGYRAFHGAANFPFGSIGARLPTIHRYNRHELPEPLILQCEQSLTASGL